MLFDRMSNEVKESSSNWNSLICQLMFPNLLLWATCRHIAELQIFHCVQTLKAARRRHLRSFWRISSGGSSVWSDLLLLISTATLFMINTKVRKSLTWTKAKLRNCCCTLCCQTLWYSFRDSEGHSRISLLKTEETIHVWAAWFSNLIVRSTSSTRSVSEADQTSYSIFGSNCRIKNIV